MAIGANDGTSLEMWFQLKQWCCRYLVIKQVRLRNGWDVRNKGEEKVENELPGWSRYQGE